MGLRCLIGHEYGEPESSRDRNQRGNEVVVTEREYRECTRCGHRRILSENKEITTETAEPSSEEADEAPPAEASWSEPPETEDQATVDAFARSPSEPAGGPDEPMTAADDDGIILDDDAEAPRRAHGEWPEADVGGEPEDAASDEHEPWPDEVETAEPDPPEPAADEPVDAGPEPSGAAETADEVAPTDEAEETEVMAGSADTTARESEGSSPRPDNRNTEFVCPDCGETWPTQDASLRPGDICPECRRGYLEERVVQ